MNSVAYKQFQHQVCLDKETGLPVVVICRTGNEFYVFLHF